MSNRGGSGSDVINGSLREAGDEGPSTRINAMLTERTTVEELVKEAT
jgi:hypothetical protein